MFDRFRVDGRYKADADLNAVSAIVASWSNETKNKGIAIDFWIAAGLMYRIAKAKPVTVPAEYLAPGHSSFLSSEDRHKVVNEVFAIELGLQLFNLSVLQVVDDLRTKELIEFLCSPDCKEATLRFRFQALRRSLSH